MRQRFTWCERCGTTNDLTVDHVVPMSIAPDTAG